MSTYNWYSCIDVTHTWHANINKCIIKIYCVTTFKPSHQSGGFFYSPTMASTFDSFVKEKSVINSDITSTWSKTPRKLGYNMEMRMVWFSYRLGQLKWCILWWGWSRLLELPSFRSADPGGGSIWNCRSPTSTAGTTELSGYIINTVAQSYQWNLAHSPQFPLGVESQHPPNPQEDTLTWKILNFIEFDLHFCALILSGLFNSSLAKPSLPQHPSHSRFCVHKTQQTLLNTQARAKDGNLWTWWSTDSQDDEYGDQSRMFKKP